MIRFPATGAGRAEGSCALSGDDRIVAGLVELHKNPPIGNMISYGRRTLYQHPGAMQSDGGPHILRERNTQGSAISDSL